jgi:hypothetical protein
LVQQTQPSFADIVNAQQQLNTFLAAYLTALQAQWQAVVDLAALAQLDDLYLPSGGPECGPPAPEPEPEPDELPPPKPVPSPPADGPALSPARGAESIEWKRTRQLPADY